MDIFTKDNKVISMRNSGEYVYMDMKVSENKLLTAEFRSPYFEIPDMISQFLAWKYEKSEYDTFHLEVYDKDFNEIKIISCRVPRMVMVIDCSSRETYVLDMKISELILEIINCIRDNVVFITNGNTPIPQINDASIECFNLKIKELYGLVYYAQSRIELDCFNERACFECLELEDE